MTSQHDRDAIIAKIKKCLALSKSANEHEAASALRQAQKLMAAHGVSDFDVENADIDEQDARSGASRNPVRWECLLVRIVAKAFGCEVFFSGSWNARPGVWRFVGVAPQAEIARYAYEVMARQLKRARAEHIKTALKRCGPTNRTRRADLFCEGWISAASKLLEGFAGTEAQAVKISGYLESKYSLSPFNGKDRSAGRSLSERDYGDLAAGSRSGRGAELNRGIGGADDRPALVGQ